MNQTKPPLELADAARQLGKTPEELARLLRAGAFVVEDTSPEHKLHLVSLHAIPDPASDPVA